MYFFRVIRKIFILFGLKKKKKNLINYTSIFFREIRKMVPFLGQEQKCFYMKLGLMAYFFSKKSKIF